MATSLQLSLEDREFFSLVLDVVTGNPFSEERPKVGVLISPGFRRNRSVREREFVATLNERLAALSIRDGGRISDYNEDDRKLVAYARLFHIYIHLVDDFDALIREEADAMETAPVKFAGRALKSLRDCGFNQKESLRYFALFYQLRRAFHFIVESLTGESHCMRRLREALWNNVFTADIFTYNLHLWNRMEDFSSILLGETGTGKGAAAAAIGRSGLIPFDPRTSRFTQSFQNTFIAANLSQFPETLIESELFGHSKGAFTGAVKDHRGLLERCSKYGSLFLDEIGDLAAPVQVKLLQVLQDRTFSPVGSDSEKRFSGRVIAATNHSLDRLRDGDTFRDDFFYRLCSDVIVVPALRQRLTESPDELELLVTVVVTRTLGSNIPDITNHVTEVLARDLPAGYPWPGNVRELEQAVRRILVTGRYEPNTGADPKPGKDDLSRMLAAVEMSMAELASRYCAVLYGQYGSYEAVARHAHLDPRTVKKYLSES